MHSEVYLIMISQSDSDIEGCLLTCPFNYSCSLPKVSHICNFPDYKICTDYQSKLLKLKATSKILH